MKRFIATFAAAVFLASALGAQAAAPASGKITVAAAANIAAVAEPLKAAFAAKAPGVAVDFVFGASGALTTQLENGAPFQVFMSADTAFPAKLAGAGKTTGAEKVYATGKLALLSVQPRDFKKGLALLKDPGIEHFAVANPETAPYGKAAQEALAAAGLWDELKGKVVFAQTIAQAVQYAAGAAGVGFINKSALYTKDLAAYTDKEGINWIEVDPASHAPIAQAFVVMKDAEKDPAAKAFADFLSSPEAKAVFLKFGYAVPK